MARQWGNLMTIQYYWNGWLWLVWVCPWDNPLYAHVRSKDERGPMWWAHEHSRPKMISLLKSLGVMGDSLRREANAHKPTHNFPTDLRIRGGDICHQSIPNISSTTTILRHHNPPDSSRPATTTQSTNSRPRRRNGNKHRRSQARQDRYLARKQDEVLKCKFRHFLSGCSKFKKKL
jgi:hypothetical protein